jgi:hypothetical protein
MSPHLVLLNASLEEVIVRSWRWLMMVLSFSAVYAAVATVTRFRVLEALLVIVKEIIGKIVRTLDSSDNRAHNLLKY